MVVTGVNGALLPPQGHRNPRGSASRGGTVPAPPSSRGHNGPESRDGPPGLLPASNPGEFAIAEAWRDVAVSLWRLVGLLGGGREGWGIDGVSIPTTPFESPSSSSGVGSSYESSQQRRGGLVVPNMSGTKGGVSVATQTTGWRPPLGDNVGGSSGSVSSCEDGSQVRCFNCRAWGHYRGECPVPIGEYCRRCGSSDHRAAGCEAKPFCRACARGGGENPHHLAGGRGCVICPPRRRRRAKARRGVARAEDVSPRKAETTKEEKRGKEILPIGGKPTMVDEGPLTGAQEGGREDPIEVPEKEEGGLAKVLLKEKEEERDSTVLDMGDLDVGEDTVPPRYPPTKEMDPHARCERCRAWGHNEEDCIIVGVSVEDCCKACFGEKETHNEELCKLDPCCYACLFRGEGDVDEPSYAPDLRVAHVAGGPGCTPCPPRRGWPRVWSPSPSPSRTRTGGKRSGGEEEEAELPGCARTRGTPASVEPRLDRLEEGADGEGPRSAEAHPRRSKVKKKRHKK